MRYVLAVPSMALLVGCTSSESVRTQYDRKMEVYGFDFTEYTEDGFLITPEGYDGDYQSMGILRVTIWPKMRRESVVVDRLQDGSLVREKVWRTGKVNPKTAVDSLYAKAKRLGADAIIRFDSKAVTQQVDQGVARTGVQARGFAIDRANN